MNLQGSISPSSSCKMNNIHRSYDFNECTHDDIRNKFQSSEQFGRMKGIGQHMNDVSIAKSFENSQNTNRVGKFGSSEHSAIVSGFNKLMIKIPMKQDEPTWFPSENSPESDELDVAAALLSMSSMQPKLVIKTKLDSIQALKNPTYARSTNTSSNKPQSTAPLINRMRKNLVNVVQKVNYVVLEMESVHVNDVLFKEQCVSIYINENVDQRHDNLQKLLNWFQHLLLLNV